MKASPEKQVSVKNDQSTPAEKLGWEDVPVGAVITEAGNGERYQTGDWRSERPVIDFEKCIQCFFCWVFCPDAAIQTEKQLVTGVDYYHCKGCGICSTECPVKCIAMVDELTFAEGASGEQVKTKVGRGA